MQLYKHCVVLRQRQGPQESDSYQGLLTCLFSHLWRKIQGSSPQQEAGGEQREGGKTNRPLREEGDLEGVKARKEGVGGSGRYSGYNLSHMARLKKTSYLWILVTAS